MTYNKLPGGKAQGCETKDFSTKEQKAISKGSKIESEEHGKTAPEEIAADHVVEHGAKYYDQKIGLPAMEKKIEKPMQKQKFVFAHISNREHPNIEAIKLIVS